MALQSFLNVKNFFLKKGKVFSKKGCIFLNQTIGSMIIKQCFTCKHFMNFFCFNKNNSDLKKNFK